MAASGTASARASAAGLPDPLRRPAFARFLTSRFLFWVPNHGASYITRSGFFGPFTLDRTALFIEIAAPNRTFCQDPCHERTALPDREQPDHLAERHHRDQRGDPDRRRG